MINIDTKVFQNPNFWTTLFIIYLAIEIGGFGSIPPLTSSAPIFSIAAIIGSVIFIFTRLITNQK